MKAGGLAVSQKGCWRKITITLKNPDSYYNRAPLWDECLTLTNWTLTDCSSNGAGFVVSL